MKVEKEHFVPIYDQIKKYMKERIIEGKLIPGEKLPPEADLAKEYNVSRGTLRKALQGLNREKFIVSKKGKVFKRKGMKGNPYLTNAIERIRSKINELLKF